MRQSSYLSLCNYECLSLDTERCITAAHLRGKFRSRGLFETEISEDIRKPLWIRWVFQSWFSVIREPDWASWNQSVERDERQPLLEPAFNAICAFSAVRNLGEEGEEAKGRTAGGSFLFLSRDELPSGGRASECRGDDRKGKGAFRSSI